jgi:hypothetical protein
MNASIICFGGASKYTIVTQCSSICFLMWCWSPGIGVSITGVGERIMTAHLAKACAEAATTAAAAAAEALSGLCSNDNLQRNPLATHDDDDGDDHDHDDNDDGDGDQMQTSDDVDSSSSEGGGGSKEVHGWQGCKSVAETWSEVLQQKILSGPPPWDCGVLGVKVTLEQGEAQRKAVGGGLLGQCGAGAGPVEDEEAGVRKGSMGEGIEQEVVGLERREHHEQEGNWGVGAGATVSGAGQSQGKAMCVEFAAVHSARSFGVGFYGPGLGVQVQLMRQGKQRGQACDEAAGCGGSSLEIRTCQVLEGCCKWPLTGL